MKFILCSFRIRYICKSNFIQMKIISTLFLSVILYACSSSEPCPNIHAYLDTEANRILAYSYAEQAVYDNLLEPKIVRFPGTFQRQKDVFFVSEDNYNVNSKFFYFGSDGKERVRGFSCKIQFQDNVVVWNDVQIYEEMCFSCEVSDWKLDPN